MRMMRWENDAQIKLRLDFMMRIGLYNLANRPVGYMCSNHCSRTSREPVQQQTD